jgi:hypothetical protein
MKNLKVIATFLVLNFAFVSAPVGAQSASPTPAPDASVSVNLRVVDLAAGQTANISSGTLTYQGKQYPVNI